MLVTWRDILHTSVWTPSNDHDTNCPEFLTVGFHMREDLSPETKKIARTFDPVNGASEKVISFPHGCIINASVIDSIV